MEGVVFIAEYLSEKPYITVNTSGSTGVPKTINLDKDLLRASALRTNRFFNITEKSHLHSAISSDFIGGKMMIVRSLLANCTFTFEKPSLTPLKGIDTRTPIDLLAVVPSQMRCMITEEYDYPEIRNVIIGGAAIPDNLRDMILQQPFKAWETYGMTETASHIALKEITPDIDYFTTLPDVHVSLDERGCLIINTPLQTVKTNDVAELLSDTRFRILGRFDNMINSGGKKVNPTEIESHIAPLTNADFYVSSMKDDKWGEKIVIAVDMSSPGADTFEKDWPNIKENLSTLIPRWKIPKQIIKLTSFSKTQNGKLIRQKF